ncbi:MAG: SIMPL domain-containing protein [Kofleriaceae bacterium]|nr:SIMPL domain-containing protein [Kofleriaceae bacterium]
MTVIETASLLHVSETAWGDAAPRAADIHVDLKADRLFSGDAAFENAKELRRLIVALTAQGIPEDAIALQGATLDISAGLFTTSSSVMYRARIRLEDLALLGGAIDAITECKHATLRWIEWDYRGGDVTSALLAECAARALAKARTFAAALGTAIDGIHAVHEEELALTTSIAAMQHDECSRSTMARARSVGSELAGLDLAPTKKVGVCVRVACKISRSNS